MNPTPESLSATLIQDTPVPAGTLSLTANRSGADMSLDQMLLAAGLTPALLMAQWGVILWSIKVKDSRIKIKMQACRPVDEQALRLWFAAMLGTEKEICIQFSPVTKCCLRPCQGCLAGNSYKREEWITPLQALQITE